MNKDVDPSEDKTGRTPTPPENDVVRAADALAERIIPKDWAQPRFCLTVTGQDGIQLIKLFETDSGLLDVEWSDPPRQTEAAHRFIEGVIQIWNSLR